MLYKQQRNVRPKAIIVETKLKYLVIFCRSRSETDFQATAYLIILRALWSFFSGSLIIILAVSNSMPPKQASVPCLFLDSLIESPTSKQSFSNVSVQLSKFPVLGKTMRKSSR